MRAQVVQHFARDITAVAIVLAAVTAMGGCDVNTALERVAKARELSSDMLVQFAKASDAANRAVMADADEMSATFAREAAQAADGVQKDVDALAPILQELKFSDEEALLAEFRKRFEAYRDVDRTILALAGQNTNLKAQRLSFGVAEEAAGAFRDSLQTILPPASGERGWQVRALAATAVGSVREIQALQAPHIAEPGDVAMIGLEKRMAVAEATARRALKDLAGLIGSADQSRLSAASAALDRLMGVNAQIVELSRRNSNVRSLALSLNQKRAVVGPCEETLRALNDALAKRGFSGTR